MNKHNKTPDIKEDPILTQIKQELTTKTQQLEDYTNTLKQLQADFENYIKRAEKEKAETGTHTSAKLLLKMLTLIDDLERALHLAKETDKETLLQGLEMIHKQAHKLLAEEGVKPLHATGKTFDPYQHEILAITDSEKEDNVVVEELQKGYSYKEKILRPSKVRIAKKKEQHNVQ